ncbi:MAG TPA: BtpA/SgcQ family protein [Candidatus Eisenbacteria bacterium]|nr:BtpA/SgcQ family protein [Candidatus Eisenbacteria bacterium]
MKAEIYKPIQNRKEHLAVKHPELQKVFATEQPMIGMVHLLPLPGYLGHPGMDVLMQDAFEKVHTLKAAGYDGVLVENDGDKIPYAGKNIERRDVVRGILKQIVEEANLLSMPVGLEILYDDLGTFQVANEAGAKFVRFDVYVDNVVTARGSEIHGNAEKIQELKHYLGSNLLIFADVHVKHAKVTDGKTLEQSAKQAAAMGADVISVTGEWTGLQPDLNDLQVVRLSIPENVSVAVGSGANAENVQTLLANGANVVLVGSSIKTNGKIDSEKAQAFIEAVKGKNDISR